MSGTDSRPPAASRAPAHPGPRNALILILSALFIFLAGSTWLALYPGVPRDLGGAPDLDRHAERVTIPVGEGDHIAAFFLPGRRHATVIVFHGYGRDHTRAWRYARFLKQAGYGVLTADFRSSRATERKPTTLGYYELEDARAMIDWLEREPRSAHDRIGLLGESLGGSVALALAAERPEVRALVVDCPFANGKRALEDSFERWAHVPRWPFAEVAGALATGLTGYDPRALDALSAASKLTGRPIYFIGSKRDDRFSQSQTEDLWRAAGAKDSLWELADCGHNEAWLSHRREYERRVLAFFGGALSGDALERPGAAVGRKSGP